MLTLMNVFGDLPRIRILWFLLHAPSYQSHLNGIIAASASNHSTVVKELLELEKLDWVQLKQYGRIKIYRLRDEIPAVHSLLNLVEYWRELSPNISFINPAIKATPLPLNYLDSLLGDEDDLPQVAVEWRDMF